MTNSGARSPTNTGAESKCAAEPVDPRVKEAFELAYKELYPNGVDFGEPPASQPPLAQPTPPPAAPGTPGYTQTPSVTQAATEATNGIPNAGG